MEAHAQVVARRGHRIATKVAGQSIRGVAFDHEPTLEFEVVWGLVRGGVPGRSAVAPPDDAPDDQAEEQKGSGRLDMATAAATPARESPFAKRRKGVSSNRRVTTWVPAGIPAVRNPSGSEGVTDTSRSSTHARQPGKWKRLKT